MSDRILLSKQEKKILISLSSGSLYKEIAADHSISINTVKKHLKNIYRKLRVNKRTLAIEKFLANPAMFDIAVSEGADVGKTG
ncbi:MAG: helix-turn-helix transcriptional regulator [Ferruginibacter sp.]